MKDVVTFKYQNYKGEVEIRRVRPIRIWFGSKAWHSEAQWLLGTWTKTRQGTSPCQVC